MLNGRLPVIETVYDRSEGFLRGGQQGLDRWAIVFKEYFYWSSPKVVIMTSTITNPWEASVYLLRIGSRSETSTPEAENIGRSRRPPKFFSN